MPDITTDKTATLTFNDTWDELTQMLGLDHNEQTYMIWLWLQYASKITLNREPDGGN